MRGLIEALPADERRHPYRITPEGLRLLHERLLRIGPSGPGGARTAWRAPRCERLARGMGPAVVPRRWRRRYGGEVRDLVDEVVGSGGSTSTQPPRHCAGRGREHCRALRRPRRAIAVLAVAVAALAGVLAATTLGAKARSRVRLPPRLASETMFVAFMDPKATAQRDLGAGPGPRPGGSRSGEVVPRITSTRRESFAEFRETFRADPDTLKGMTLGMMPPSFRCTLARDSREFFPVSRPAWWPSPASTRWRRAV